MYDWIYDDKTWCGNECSNIECERNQIHILNKNGLHSYAMFKNTETCPMYQTAVMWEDFNKEIEASNIYPSKQQTNVLCPNCGERLWKRTDIVLTTYPPQYLYECKCGWNGTAHG